MMAAVLQDIEEVRETKRFDSKQTQLQAPLNLSLLTPRIQRMRIWRSWKEH
jgi:hypothetical protein